VGRPDRRFLTSQTEWRLLLLGDATHLGRLIHVTVSMWDELGDAAEREETDVRCRASALPSSLGPQGCSVSLALSAPKLAFFWSNRTL
jgi:hypothetical protein